MEIRVYYDPQCLLHENDPGHPERPERVRTLIEHISGLDAPPPIVAPQPAALDALLRVHTAQYVESVRRTADHDHTRLDPDTGANRHTWGAALLSAGGALDATHAVMAGERVRPFVAMRPPGHHALADKAMGFCVFNNVAVAAAEALALGSRRVAIVDWDVHHGNGTEAIFWDRSDVFYASIHQSPHYPGTGRPRAIGAGDGRGANVNVPLPAGCGEAEYLRVTNEVILPSLDRYDPDLILVSAGFDAHERDPLAGMLLNGRAYYLITERLRAFADERCNGRIVHLLEGGYDLEGLVDGADNVLRSLAREGAADGELAEGTRGQGTRGESVPRSGFAAELADQAIRETLAALEDT